MTAIILSILLSLSAQPSCPASCPCYVQVPDAEVSAAATKAHPVIGGKDAVGAAAEKTNAVTAEAIVDYKTAHAAALTGQPVLVMVSGPGCIHCQRMKNEVIPAARKARYLDGVVVCYVESSEPDAQPLVRWAGLPQMYPQFYFLVRAQRWHAWKHLGAMTLEELAQFAGN